MNMDIVLTTPISLEWGSTSSPSTTTSNTSSNNIHHQDDEDYHQLQQQEVYKAPNLLQRVFSLFKNVRPGTDLTKFQLPPTFNIPKSHLQCYGESVYSVNKDMLRECAIGESSVNRMIAVVAWSLSTLRPLMFGVAPYNPILGETHHVSSGSLNVLLEQVSHHPPVSALHGTDASSNVELVWCQQLVPKFYGTTIETEVHGQRRLKLLSKGETYITNSPKLLIRLFPIPSVSWVGKVSIHCQETNLEAELHYGSKGSSFFGFNNNSTSVKGKIIDSLKKTPLYEIDGRWDRTVTIKDLVDGGKMRNIYEANEVVSRLKTPIVKDQENVMLSESAVVWAEVSRGILSQNWEKAKGAKHKIEEKERELVKEQNANGGCDQNWSPKFFVLNSSKDFDNWDCDPIGSSVPPAPIVFPN